MEDTVNARISARGAYLHVIFRVETVVLIRSGLHISPFKFRPQEDIVFISSKYKKYQ